MNNTVKIYNSYKELIEYLNSLPTDKQKLEGLFAYLIDNCEYNYDILKLAKIQANGVEKHEQGVDIENENQRLNTLNTLQKEYGFSKQTLDLLSIEYGNCEEFDGYKYYTDLEMAVSNVFLSQISCSTMQNGLIIKGVCDNFAKFITKVCKDIGIDCYYIKGISANNINHAWNKIIIDGVEKYFDVTYEIFIRDNYDGWGQTAKTGSWLNITDEQMQVLQPTRTLYKSKTSVLQP